MKFCKNHPQRRAVNMKYELCDECNYKRLHDGKSKFEITKEGLIKNKLLKVQPIEYKPKLFVKFLGIEKIKKKRKKKSESQKLKIKKKQDEAQLYRLACEKMDNEQEHVCSGCGTHEALSHSHVISRADCNKIGRPELIHDIKNLRYHCMDRPEIFGCHRKWESRNKETMSQLLDYKSNMEYIKLISLSLYNKLVNR